MRQIKFRGWDHNEGRFLSWEEMQEGTVQDVFRVFELNQFTGLLDKNGKEIYEGDILLCTSEKVRVRDNKPTGKIVTKLQSIEWQEEWSRFQLKNAQGVFELLPCTKQEWITMFREVVGNIYEHPELLTR